MDKRFLFPDQGAANNTAYLDQPERSCPPSALLNCRAYTISKDRPSGGMRPGLVKAFTQNFGTDPCGVGVITRARTPKGFRLGSGSEVTTGRSQTIGALAGQVWGLRSNFGMFVDYYENVSAGGPYSDAGSASTAVTVCKWGPNDLLAIAETYAAPVTKVCRITLLNAKTFARIWSVKIATFGVDRTCRDVLFTDEWLLCAVENKVIGITLSGGVKSSEAVITWADEITGLALTPDKHVLVAFNGSSVAGSNSMLNPALHGNVTVGKYARQWRSGVMKCYQNPPGGTPAAVYPVVQVPLSTQLDKTNVWFEGDYTNNVPHNTCRMSEKLPRDHRGALIGGIAPMSDGGFIVVHTNSGWGPDSTIGHTYYRAPNVNEHAPTVISRFSAAGELAWTSDTNSIIRTGDGGFPNDIPASGSDQATLTTVVTDADGTAYAAGQDAVYRVDADGTPRWANYTAGAFTAGAVAVLASKNIIATGARVSSKNLWEFSRDTGDVVRSFDLGAAVRGYAASADTSGNVFYVTEKV